MKGFYKGFKYTLSQMFVVKEDEAEMVIGSPTDVKHLAHIGWDGPSGAAPTWMNGLKVGSDFAATSIGNTGSALSPWSSQHFGTSSIRPQQEPEMYKDICHGDLSNIKKKQKRKKTKSSSTSSPKSTSRYARAATKEKTNFVSGNGNPSIEVA